MFNQKPLFYLDDSKFKGATLQPRGVKLKLILASIFIGLSLAPKAIMATPVDISGVINSEEQRIRSIRQGAEDPFITDTQRRVSRFKRDRGAQESRNLL